MYVNLTSTKEVGVVDLVKRELITKWPVPGVEAGGNALALDEPHHRLFIATADRRSSLCSTPIQGNS
jgi:hypothetical protein